MSLSVMEEKWALKMLLFLTLVNSDTLSITSKQMFSPSLSQSSHSTKKSEPFASDAKKFGILSFGVVSFFSAAQTNNSAGSVLSQLLNFALKSRLNT